jgi:hypothetical protein
MSDVQKGTPAPPTPELPNAYQREVGEVWLRMYLAHNPMPDLAFAAAGVWRMMWIARHDPDAPDLRAVAVRRPDHWRMMWSARHDPDAPDLRAVPVRRPDHA